MLQRLDYRLLVREEEVAHRLRELKVSALSLAVFFTCFPQSFGAPSRYSSPAAQNFECTLPAVISTCFPLNLSALSCCHLHLLFSLHWNALSRSQYPPASLDVSCCTLAVVGHGPGASPTSRAGTLLGRSEAA
jgi:hypothetical protein